MAGDAVLDLRPIDRPSNQPFDRCDTAVLDAARDDEVEIAEVGCDIKRESVARDPPRDTDADGRQLLVTRPDAGQAIHASRRDAVVGRRADENLFQIADVAMNVLSIRLQV